MKMMKQTEASENKIERNVKNVRPTTIKLNEKLMKNQNLRWRENAHIDMYTRTEYNHFVVYKNIDCIVDEKDTKPLSIYALCCLYIYRKIDICK